MRQEAARAVSEADLERQLAIVRAAAAGQEEGIFGPQSMLWRIDREAAIFLGAGRALLLQLAHPWVAAAIARHSTTLADPIGRFHRTFAVVFTMVFGTLDQALAAARRLHRRHAEITGALPEAAGRFAADSPYRANDVAALAWVHATLIETALLAHDLVLPPLSAIERERYWREARLFAALFGIPEAALPDSWEGFLAYCAAMRESDGLVVGEEARRIGAAVMNGAGTWLRPPAWYRALTASLLPPRLRSAFGLVDNERQAARALAAIRRIYPLLPPVLRRVGPYQEARSRLAGRPRPGLVVRRLDRFWIGRDAMPD